MYDHSGELTVLLISIWSLLTIEEIDSK